MKKTILNSFVWALVFCLTCFGIIYLTKARITTNPNITDTTPSALYVNNNETLTAAKRNSLVDRFKIYQIKLTHDISMWAHASWATINDLTLDVPVWASGKILVWLYCNSYRWGPLYRINIDNGTNYEYLLGWGGTFGAKWAEAVLSWYTPWTTKNLKIDWANGSSAEWSSINAASDPTFYWCTMIAKTW